MRPLEFNPYLLKQKLEQSPTQRLMSNLKKSTDGPRARTKMVNTATNTMTTSGMRKKMMRIPTGTPMRPTMRNNRMTARTSRKLMRRWHPAK